MTNRQLVKKLWRTRRCFSACWVWYVNNPCPSHGYPIWQIFFHSKYNTCLNRYSCKSGLYVSTISLISLGILFWLHRIGRKHGSPTCISDRHHSFKHVRTHYSIFFLPLKLYRIVPACLERVPTLVMRNQFITVRFARTYRPEFYGQLAIFFFYNKSVSASVAFTTSRK
jgi:hypothetical protein